MSIQDINTKEIIVKNEDCNNFVILYKELKELSKLLKSKNIRSISYEVKVKYKD